MTIRPPVGSLLTLLSLLAVVTVGLWAMLHMPGTSFRGPLPPLTQHELALEEALRRDVQALAGAIGERHLLREGSLEAAAEMIERSLRAAGCTVHRHTYEAWGKICHNLEVELRGAKHPEEIVIIGAHYDAVEGSPGANDNASGVAAALALARRFCLARPARTLRFVWFTNEEPPYFFTDAMGSLHYARRCRERGERVVAMLSLETIGYYTDAPRSQSYPSPIFHLLYPSTGNFVGFVGNLASRALVRRAIGSFRRHAAFPSEGVAMFAGIPGVAWSDQWAFWQHRYPAIMVTDTAPFRYPHYHSVSDTPDKLRYDRLARVVAGLEGVVADLASLP